MDIQQNFAQVGTPEIDALFDKATAEFDRQQAVQLGKQIDAAIWDEVHSLTLSQRPNIIATGSKLANNGAFGFASVRYEDIGLINEVTCRRTEAAARRHGAPGTCSQPAKMAGASWIGRRGRRRR